RKLHQRWKLSPSLVRAVLLLVAGALSLPGQENAPSSSVVPPEEVVLTVGEKKFTAAEFDKILATLPQQYQQVLKTKGKAAFTEQYVNLLSLAMEGEKRQLDQAEEFRQMMEFNRQALLATLTLNALVAESASVGPEEVEYYYQTNRQEFEQVKVTGIYIPFSTAPASGRGAPQTASAKPAYTEQQAQRKALELRARILSGQNMAALARTESEHPTASKGGDFGYIGRNQTQLPGPIVNAIFALQTGQISAPLKDKNGFYLFLAEEKRLQPLDEIKEGIQTSLGIQKMNRRLEALKESYPVVLNPRYFTDAVPAPSRPAGSQP
ncbi:MAG TPA: peptidylprolyl isomerase, partial [Terriglobia bacterium]|nr:peptidylprolyl isomerase [Terriglobia bacterium]